MEHDPFNDPELAHPRAQELLVEDFFWNCFDEESPFGSDEGHDAHYEYRDWRATNPKAPLTERLAWIMNGQLSGYTAKLCTDHRIEADLAKPDAAFLGGDYDVFTLDATVVATVLGQLLDEGHIDPEAKPYARVAVQRQLHSKVVTSERRSQILVAIERAIDSA